MKNWITPNTIILLVLLVALVHLHACMNGPAPESKKEKAVLKSTVVKDAGVALQRGTAVDYADREYHGLVNKVNLLKGREQVRIVYSYGIMEIKKI